MMGSPALAMSREDDTAHMPVHSAASLAAADAAYRLDAEQIDVWAVDLHAAPALLAHLETWLAADELARAQRFVFDRDRRRFVVARALLRLLLGRYLRQTPQELSFIYGEAGKPSLDPRGQPALEFNLSHSADRALLAVSGSVPIGVDIESSTRAIDVLAIANRYFYGREFDAIAAAPAPLQRDAFLRHWVAKEAVLKGEGIGIGFALERFSICFEGQGERARSITHVGDVPAKSWCVRMLSLEPGWHGAVALPADSFALRFPTCRPV